MKTAMVQENHKMRNQIFLNYSAICTKLETEKVGTDLKAQPKIETKKYDIY